MDFKKYVSTLFYLNEAHSYASPTMKTEIQNLITQTNDEAFEDTGYYCFKLFNDLKVEFPSLGWKWNSPKDSLKKTSANFSIHRRLTDEEVARIGPVEEYRQVDLKQEEISVCGGQCSVVSVAWSNPYHFEGSPMIMINFELAKAQRYTDANELNPLIECLRNMLTNV